MDASSISVVIPFFNGELSLLRETLESVRSQTIAPLETIIVDDGSDAEVAMALDTLCEPGLRIVRQTNLGPGAARNRGAAEARGYWLAFLDGDDTWHPQKLEQQLSLAQANHRACCLILCRTETALSTGELVRQNRFDEILDADEFVELIAAGSVHSFTSALFLSRECFSEIGGFDESLRYRQDQLFLVKAVRKLGWLCAPDVLSRRVLHPSSYTSFAREPQGVELYERQVRFANALGRIEPTFSRRKFLALEAMRIGKRKAASRRLGEACAMATRALVLQPTQIKHWLLVAAALVAWFFPRPFKRWLPPGAEAHSHNIV
jgi:glycosyltransferase involved in cell wall biosynthesis